MMRSRCLDSRAETWQAAKIDLTHNSFEGVPIVTARVATSYISEGVVAGHSRQFTPGGYLSAVIDK